MHRSSTLHVSEPVSGCSIALAEGTLDKLEIIIAQKIALVMRRNWYDIWWVNGSMKSGTWSTTCPSPTHRMSQL